LKQANEAEARLEEKQIELEEKKLLAQNLIKFGPQDNFSLSSIRKQIPEREYIEFILRDLKSLEEYTDLTFSNYNVSNADENDAEQGDTVNLQSKAVVPLQVSFTFRGKRAQLDEFVEELQWMNRVYQIERINITTEARIPVAIVDVNEIVNCSVTLRTFFLPSLQNYFKQQIPLDSF
jgi:hypothetical protein